MISSLELARLCGVSQGTVDRALHGRPGISAATRERILAVASERGYLPNPAARELMGLATSSVVGVVMPEDAVQVIFFMDLIAEIGRHLRQHGLRLALWPAQRAEYAAVAGEIAARRLRALVLMLPSETMRLEPTITRTIPVISLLLPNRSEGVVALMPDERGIGRAATRHLLDLGHRRIAHIPSTSEHWSSLERSAGYGEAMIAAGLESLIVPDLTDGRSLERLRATGATAVFCHHDPAALALIRSAQRAGLAVPGDLSVIGVDRSPTAAALDPSLTSVVYPYAGIAAQVAAVIQDRELPALPPAEVIRGLTTAPFPHPPACGG